MESEEELESFRPVIAHELNTARERERELYQKRKGRERKSVTENSDEVKSVIRKRNPERAAALVSERVTKMSSSRKQSFFLFHPPIFLLVSEIRERTLLYRG